MQFPGSLKPVLDYIERNLKTDITAEELARMAGYSTFHFYRLFSAAAGSSVAGYILKRRLDHALAEIARGRKAAEVVLEYGYDTYAGFYKAFVKLYGCSPKQYLHIYNHYEITKPEVLSMHAYTKTELRKILENWNIPRGLPIENVKIAGTNRFDDSEWTLGGEYLLKTGDRVQRFKHLKIANALGGMVFPRRCPSKRQWGRISSTGKIFSSSLA